LIVIRDIRQISELREVEELQKDVWGMEDRDVFPALAVIPMLEVGAVLIGAFDDEKMVGFVFGFPGLEDGRVILHSDLLAVRAEYRGHGLGYKLKLAQRDRALAKEMDTITWTFDPLQAGNAHLNLHKLGGIAERYRVNYYGETSSFLHRTGTDRLWVAWRLKSEGVLRRIGGGSHCDPPDLQGLPRFLRVGPNREPVVGDTQVGPASSVIVEIPDDINALLKENVGLAVRWREATRIEFLKAIDAGFVIEDFWRGGDGRQEFGVYVLCRAPSAF
jgi:predicted GNAT superfamily acetyltransferase